MAEILATIAQLAVLTFVLSSMVALGLTLTTKQIVTPLKNAQLVVMALVANFVVVPGGAWAVASVLGLDDSLTLGLLLLGTAAGAPFLPKLAQIAKGDVAYSVGLMVLLHPVGPGPAGRGRRRERMGHRPAARVRDAPPARHRTRCPGAL